MSVKIFKAEAVPASASAATLRIASATFSSATNTATRILRAEGSLFASTARRIAFSGISFTARKSYRLRVRRSTPSRCSMANSRQSLSVASDRSVNVNVMPPSSRRITDRPTPGFGVQLRGFISFMFVPPIRLYPMQFSRNVSHSIDSHPAKQTFQFLLCQTAPPFRGHFSDWQDAPGQDQYPSMAEAQILARAGVDEE